MVVDGGMPVPGRNVLFREGDGERLGVLDRVVVMSTPDVIVVFQYEGGVGLDVALEEELGMPLGAIEVLLTESVGDPLIVLDVLFAIGVGEPLGVDDTNNGAVPIGPAVVEFWVGRGKPDGVTYTVVVVVVL